MQERNVVGLQLWALPVLCRGSRQRIDTEQWRRIGSSQLVHLQQGRLQIGAGQQQTRLGIGDDRQQSLLVMATIGFRRISRHGNDPGIQAAEERRNIVGPAMEQQNCPIPGTA